MTKPPIEAASSRQIEIEELLKEWAFFYRDIEHYYRYQVGSLEGAYVAFMDSYIEGWGDSQIIPEMLSKSVYSKPRADITNDIIQGMPALYKFALTYHYCYPKMRVGTAIAKMRSRFKWRMKKENYEAVINMGRGMLFKIVSRTTCAAYR